MLLMLYLGIEGALGLKRATFPNAKLGEVEITINYPGASAYKVEETLCLPMETAVEGLVGKKEVQCFASPNQARMLVLSEEGADFPRLLQDVKTELESLDNLPEDAEKMVIRHRNRLDPVISLLVSASLPDTALLDYSLSLKDRLLHNTGLARVTIQGFSQRQFLIRVREEVLQHYHLSLPQLAGIVQRSNRDTPIGMIHTSGQEMRLLLKEENTTIQDLEKLVILSRPDGFELTLGDIARIQSGFEFEEEMILFQGQRAALLKLSMAPEDDVLDLDAQVKEFITKERQMVPEGVHFHWTRDNANIVRDRLSMLQSNAVQGLILVCIVLYLFFNLRLSFWVVMGLPISFAGAFFLMYHGSQSLNMMTMVGLLLGIGILMDDAVVISENIVRHYHDGKKPLDACIDGVREVLSSVLSSFLTTLAMFGGLTVMEGDIGRILKSMPLVLIFVLLSSLLEAFLILPSHLSHSLRARCDENWLRKRFLSWFENFRDQQFSRSLQFAISNRYISVGVMVIILCLSIGAITGGYLRFSAIPDLEGSTVVSRILMPSGTPLSETREVGKRVLEGIHAVDGAYQKEYGSKLLRGAYIRFSWNQDVQEKGAHVATVYADLVLPEERKITLSRLLDQWRDWVGVIPGVTSLSFQEPVLGPAGRPVHLRFFHKDLKVLEKVAREVKQELSRFRGISNVMSDLRIGEPEIRIQLKDGSRGSGIDAQDMGTQLFGSIHGIKVGEVPTGEDTTEIIVTASREDQSRHDFLDQYLLFQTGEGSIPLDQVARVEKFRDYARISRSDGRRMVNVTAEIDTKLTNALAITRFLKRGMIEGFQNQYPSLEYTIEGSLKNAGETSGSIRKAFLGGIVGLFLILSYQFGCYLQPFLILLTIPFSLIGVVLGHLLLGFDLSLPSLMGFVALSGVVVNNSILVVQFISQHSEDGKHYIQAAVDASKKRFRPIFITTATTLAGMLPLLFEKSLQAQILKPLVISLTFGLASATVLILYFLPCLYGMKEDLSQWRSEARES